MCRAISIESVEHALRNLMLSLLIVPKRCTGEEIMDGKRSQAIERDRPIAKPAYPLPAVFSPSKLAELPTRAKNPKSKDELERAYFYRERTNEYGSPVYGFFITKENAGRAARQK